MEERKKKFDFGENKNNLNKEVPNNDVSSSGDLSKSQSQTVEEIITGEPHDNLVVFIGPQGTGKTVALMRLTHYLVDNEVTNIEVNRLYRDDEHYQKSANEFLDDLHQPNFSPGRTGAVDFLLLDVYKGAEIYCQFLEAPGEAFYKRSDPHSLDFPAYISKILNDSKINKVFVFFFTDNMLREGDPKAYSKRLARLVRRLDRKKDDVIVLYNKADEQFGLFKNDKPNVKAFKNRLYKNIAYSEFFGALKDLGIPVKFVPFTSGDFQNIPGKKDIQRWIHSKDFYPKTLWRTIDKCFKSYSWWRF